MRMKHIDEAYFSIDWCYIQCDTLPYQRCRADRTSPSQLINVSLLSQEDLETQKRKTASAIVTSGALTLVWSIFIYLFISLFLFFIYIFFILKLFCLRSSWLPPWSRLPSWCLPSLRMCLVSSQTGSSCPRKQSRTFDQVLVWKLILVW